MNAHHLFAWSVHLFTASGVVMGLLALLAALAGDYRAAFLWLFASVLVDASDGWLARLARVRDRLPWVDGARLDDIVDYVTFVFVPTALLYQAGSLPAGWALPMAAAILISSALGFSYADAKTSDHLFTGFPSYWNVAALYLYLARLPPALNATILLVLCGLVFLRSTYVYPTRTTAFRAVTTPGLVGWGAALLWMIWRLPERSPGILVGSLAFPVYYTILSIVLHRRRGRAAAQEL